MADFGANTQLWHLLPYASRVSLPHTCKACFRLAGSAFAGRESNPLDRCERFQLVSIILLSCSPDATTLTLPGDFDFRAPGRALSLFPSPSRTRDMERREAPGASASALRTVARSAARRCDGARTPMT